MGENCRVPPFSYPVRPAVRGAATGVDRYAELTRQFEILREHAVESRQLARRGGGFRVLYAVA
jgi:hypothetical protein